MRSATKAKAVLYSALGGSLLLVVCAALIPNYISPPRRVRAPQNTCINNLRQIDGAKQQWALEKNTLSNAIPTVSELAFYLGGKKRVEEIIRCPSGGKYNFNPVWIAPTCSITNHSLEPR